MFADMDENHSFLLADSIANAGVTDTSQADFADSNIMRCKLIDRLFEPRRKKTDIWGFRPCLTHTGLYSHRKWLAPYNLVFRK